MRAAVIHEHGDPENLVYEANFPDPECGPGDVVVRVKASSLNYHDIFTRRGMPGIRLDLPVICGLDVAGEIAEIGLNTLCHNVPGPVVSQKIRGPGDSEFCQLRSNLLR